MRYRTDLMESILTSPQAQKIIDYITPIYGEAYVCLWLLQIIGIVLDEGETFTEEFTAQVTPITATWTLNFWEKAYGINVDPSWDMEQRRQNIMATMRYKAPINPKKLEDLVSAIVGMPVSVIENSKKNHFHVIIYGFTEEYSRAVENIDRMKPAHLTYTLQCSDVVEVAFAYTRYAAVTSEFETFSVPVADNSESTTIYLTDEDGYVLTDENGYILTY